MGRTYRFVTVDVFTDHQFGGNQLAVILDAEGLSTDEMQAIANEFNYSESTFVLPARIPGAVRRVRIFTPSEEMPFAGHPTVGTIFVLMREGIIPLQGTVTEVVLEENIGPVTIRIEPAASGSNFIWMQHRPPEWGMVYQNRAAVARLLGLAADDLMPDLPVQVVSTGVPYLIVPLRDLATIKRVRFDVGAQDSVFGAGPTVAVFAFTPEAETSAGTVHSRMFAPSTVQIFEDPATGSASGPLGAYLVRYGVIKATAETRLVSEQGFEMGRPSLISITVSTTDGEIGDIWIGGQAVLVAEGTLYIN
jgi:trans-2,3-dihydro-3-hydroxyanthranilate isomerase